jgi:replicative DNA helicase
MDEPIPPTIPHSREAEEALLGAVLINPDAYYDAADFLKAGDFYIHRHQSIWNAFTRLNENRTPIDLLTVSEELDRMGQLNDVGGSAYLIGLINQVPSSLNAEAYGRIIQTHSTRRKIIKAAGRMAQLAYDESIELDELTGRCISELEQAVNEAMGQGLVHISEPLSEMYDRMTEASQKQEIPGIPTDIESIDNILGNIKTGLIVIASRPGQGKTSFKHTVGMNVARQGKRVAIFSLEMSGVEISERFTAIDTEINLQAIRSGQLDAEEWARVNQSIETVERLQIYVDDTPELTVAQIEAKCKRLIMREGALDLVIVDYLQLVSPPFKTSEGNRSVAVDAISRGLRVLARRLNVPVLTGAQLNRESEKENRRPRLSDLRESGGIESEAYVVMFPYQDEDEGTCEMIIAKHRNGPTGTAEVRYRKEITRFEDV